MRSGSYERASDAVSGSGRSDPPRWTRSISLWSQRQPLDPRFHDDSRFQPTSWRRRTSTAERVRHSDGATGRKLWPQIVHWLRHGRVAKEKIINLSKPGLRAIPRGRVGKDVEFGLKWGIQQEGGGFVLRHEKAVDASLSGRRAIHRYAQDLKIRFQPPCGTLRGDDGCVWTSRSDGKQLESRLSDEDARQLRIPMTSPRLEQNQDANRRASAKHPSVSHPSPSPSAWRESSALRGGGRGRAACGGGLWGTRTVS